MTPTLPETAEEEAAGKAQELLAMLPAEERQIDLTANTEEAVLSVDDFITNTITPFLDSEYKATITADNQYAIEAAEEAEEIFKAVTGTYSATITAVIVPPAGYGGGGNEAPGDAGYAVGGFTGFGSDTDIAGVVHRNEYVLSSTAVDNMGGPAVLDAMHEAARGGGGMGGNVTVNNYNNSREAAAMSYAMVEHIRRQRLDNN